MNPSRRLLPSAAAVAVSAALVLGSCSSDGGPGGTSDATSAPSADRQAVVTELVDEVIEPQLQSAASAVTAARDTSAAYCAAPSPATLQAARTAVDEGITAYERLDPVDMGPIMLQRTDGHVVYPTDTERLEELLTGSPATDAASIGSRTPSSTRGLTAAEHLLVSGPAPATVPVRCAFLIGVTADAADSVAQVVAASVDGADGATAYFDRLAGRSSDAEPPKETVDVIVNMMMNVLDQDAGLLADPNDRPEASVRRAAAAHLAAIGALWGDGSTGLSQLVGGDLERQLADEIEAARRALDDPSLPSADAQAAVEAVRATIGTEVVSALDVVVGFSENDGDS